MNDVDVVLKRFDSPDEARTFAKGRLEIVRIGGLTIGRATYEPGWRWSEHVGPTVGATRCVVEHVGLVLAGTATAALDDGRVIELRAGELFHIPPTPHDSWVVGDETYVSLHFLGAERYAVAEGATGDVAIRAVAQEDLPILFEHQLDPEAVRMAAFPSRDREAFMAHWAKVLGEGTGVTRTILFRNQVAGNILIFDRGGEREVGYWLGKEFWGKGIASKALSALLEENAERPLHARVASHNLASIRVLQKCGFTITGQEQGKPGPGGEEIVDVMMKLD